jgi:hypothetical protein
MLVLLLLLLLLPLLHARPVALFDADIIWKEDVYELLRTARSL